MCRRPPRASIRVHGGLPFALHTFIIRVVRQPGPGVGTGRESGGGSRDRAWARRGLSGQGWDPGAVGGGCRDEVMDERNRGDK